MRILMACVVALCVAGCQKDPVTPALPAKSQQIFTQEDLAKMVSYEVTVEGNAVDLAGGAAIQGGKYLVYIDGIKKWPAGTAGKEIKAHGMLQRREATAKADPSQGPPPVELILKDAKW